MASHGSRLGGEDVGVVQVGVHQPGVDAARPRTRSRARASGPARRTGAGRRAGRRQRAQPGAAPRRSSRVSCGVRARSSRRQQAADHGAGVVHRDACRSRSGSSRSSSIVQAPGRPRAGAPRRGRPTACRARCSCRASRVRPGDLEDGRLAAAAAHRQHERAHAVPGRPSGVSSQRCSEARTSPGSRSSHASPVWKPSAGRPRSSAANDSGTTTAPVAGRVLTAWRARGTASGAAPQARGLGLQLGRPAHQPDQPRPVSGSRPRRRCRPRAGGRGAGRGPAWPRTRGWSPRTAGGSRAGERRRRRRPGACSCSSRGRSVASTASARARPAAPDWAATTSRP